MCLLGVSLTSLLILGVKSPENPNFEGMNRRFQAKRQNIESFMLSKYCIDFNQILHNDKDDREGPLNVCVCVIETIKKSSWVVPIGAQQIQDGGRSPF